MRCAGRRMLSFSSLEKFFLIDLRNTVFVIVLWFESELISAWVVLQVIGCKHIIAQLACLWKAKILGIFHNSAILLSYFEAPVTYVCFKIEVVGSSIRLKLRKNNWMCSAKTRGLLAMVSDCKLAQAYLQLYKYVQKASEMKAVIITKGQGSSKYCKLNIGLNF